MSYILILFFALFCAVLILYFAIKHKHSPGASSLMVFAVSLVLAAAANFAIYRAPFLDIFFLWASLVLTTTLCFSALLVFWVQFTRREALLTPVAYLGLSIEPLLIQIVFWSNTRFLLSPSAPRLGANLLFQNPWFLITTTYVNILLLLSLLLLAMDFSFRPMTYRFQTWFILVGIAVAILINNNATGSNFFPFQDIQLISLLVISLTFIPSLFFEKFLRMPPIGREIVVEHMSDGWIVLDRNNNIIDVNPMAEKILQKTASELSGQPAENIFKNWPNLKNSLNESRPLEMKGSVQVGDDWTYLNIYLYPLSDGKSDPYGKLIVWRDITARRIADDARQQARDEIFILLHSITSAAGRALNLDDFLQEIIYQIVYTFHSQSIAVYQLDDQAEEDSQPYFTLAAQHGLPLYPDGKTFSFLELGGLVAQVIDHSTTILVTDSRSDQRLPPEIQKLDQMSLLLMPMQVQGDMLGFIGISREGNQGYEPDEIARLEAVVDEVGSFIDSNRQRQLSIALAERQRLVHDLHDSVTQKLYTLVMMSEATRAGIKSGKTDMPARVIDSMAELARQALKEMRLFLYQMQPIDFARDGLALVLQQRLSAVEGRADIVTKINIDSKIILPMEIQLALYFISQEALNNILKHSKAKNVRISLQTQPPDYVLEIEDDGLGFDLQTIDMSGIGFKSMVERAAQIGGKLKIDSTPGVGTKISVTFQNDENGRGVK